MKNTLILFAFILFSGFANKTFAQSQLPTPIKGCGPGGGGTLISMYQIHCPECHDFNYSTGPVHSCEIPATNPIPGNCPRCIEIKLLPANLIEVTLLSTGQIWQVHDIIVDEMENGTIVTLLP